MKGPGSGVRGHSSVSVSCLGIFSSTDLDFFFDFEGDFLTLVLPPAPRVFFLTVDLCFCFILGS